MVYIMLCNMTQTTRDRIANVPNLIEHTTSSVGDEQNRVLSHYATLGRYDLIVFAEAEAHVNAAQLSIALSTATGMNIETMPTMNMSSLEDNAPSPVAQAEPEPLYQESVAISTPTDDEEEELYLEDTADTYMYFSSGPSRPY